MQLKDAIEKVLRMVGKPLDAKEITDRILAEGLWQTNGKTPAATVASRISVKRALLFQGARQRMMQ